MAEFRFEYMDRERRIKADNYNNSSVHGDWKFTKSWDGRSMYLSLNINDGGGCVLYALHASKCQIMTVFVEERDLKAEFHLPKSVDPWHLFSDSDKPVFKVKSFVIADESESNLVDEINKGIESEVE